MTDKFKDVRVNFTFKYSGGGISKGDFRSNAPHAKTPATPEQTLANVVDHFVFMATAYDSGDQVMQAAFDAFHRANQYREKQEHPKATVEGALRCMVEGLGYSLVKIPANGKAHALTAHEVQESREAADPEIAWERTWKHLVMNEDGTVNIEHLKDELSDFSTLIDFSSRVYDHATGGRCTKTLTWPSVVCSVIDDHLQDRDRAVEETTEGAFRTALEHIANGHPNPALFARQLLSIGDDDGPKTDEGSGEQAGPATPDKS